jgi:site-specific DNA recombinase
MFPVVIYARFSTSMQDARSIDDQIRRCTVFALSKGYEIIAIYKDEAKSGANVDREGLQKLWADIQAKGSKVKAVIVDDLSRLSRDLGDAYELVFKKFTSVGVKTIDVMTTLASDQPGAKLMFGVMSLVNSAFLDNLRSEVHRGLEGRAIGGYSTGGRIFGYRSEQEPNPPDKEHPRAVWTVCGQEAGVVKRIFGMALEGLGINKIANKLTLDGVGAPRGGKWSPMTVKRILADSRYIGKFVWNKRKNVAVTGNKCKRLIFREESDWRVTEIPGLAIVDKDLFSKVQNRRNHAQRF